MLCPISHDGRDKEVASHDGTDKEAAAHDGTEEEAASHAGTDKEAAAHDGTGEEAAAHDGTEEEAAAHVTSVHLYNSLTILYSLHKLNTKTRYRTSNAYLHSCWWYLNK